MLSTISAAVTINVVSANAAPARRPSCATASAPVAARAARRRRTAHAAAGASTTATTSATSPANSTGVTCTSAPVTLCVAVRTTPITQNAASTASGAETAMPRRRGGVARSSIVMLDRAMAHQHASQTPKATNAAPHPAISAHQSHAGPMCAGSHQTRVNWSTPYASAIPVNAPRTYAGANSAAPSRSTPTVPLPRIFKTAASPRRASARKRTIWSSRMSSTVPNCTNSTGRICRT